MAAMRRDLSNRRGCNEARCDICANGCGRHVVFGLDRSGALGGSDAPQTAATGREALTLPTTVRDHRDAIYRTLMFISINRKDNAAAAKWGGRWLAELDAIK